MSLANDSLLVALSNEGVQIYDNAAAPSVTIGSATRLIGAAMRVTTSVASGLVVLPSLLSNEAPFMWWVINDSPNTILVQPFNSATFPEKQGGANNATLSIPSGQSGYGFKVSQTGKGGGTTNTIDWRSAVIP